MIEKNKITKNKIKEYNPLALAFIGDSVHTLFVRDYLLKRKNLTAGNFHVLASRICRAKSQSEFFDKIFSLLTDEEKEIAIRAKNHKSHVAKNASLEDYHKATAFEAVLGYLYLTGEKERLDKILEITIE